MSITDLEHIGHEYLGNKHKVICKDSSHYLDYCRTMQKKKRVELKVLRSLTGHDPSSEQSIPCALCAHSSKLSPVLMSQKDTAA